jgi:hypothetical protein
VSQIPVEQCQEDRCTENVSIEDENAGETDQASKSFKYGYLGSVGKDSRNRDGDNTVGESMEDLIQFGVVNDSNVCDGKRSREEELASGVEDLQAIENCPTTDVAEHVQEYRRPGVVDTEDSNEGSKDNFMRVGAALQYNGTPVGEWSIKQSVDEAQLNDLIGVEQKEETVRLSCSDEHTENTNNKITAAMSSEGEFSSVAENKNAASSCSREMPNNAGDVDKLSEETFAEGPTKSQWADDLRWDYFGEGKSPAELVASAAICGQISQGIVNSNYEVALMQITDSVANCLTERKSKFPDDIKISLNVTDDVGVTEHARLPECLRETEDSRIVELSDVQQDNIRWDLPGTVQGQTVRYLQSPDVDSTQIETETEHAEDDIDDFVVVAESLSVESETAYRHTTSHFDAAENTMSYEETETENLCKLQSTGDQDESTFGGAPADGNVAYRCTSEAPTETGIAGETASERNPTAAAATAAAVVASEKCLKEVEDTADDDGELSARHAARQLINNHQNLYIDSQQTSDQFTNNSAAVEAAAVSHETNEVGVEKRAGRTSTISGHVGSLCPDAKDRSELELRLLHKLQRSPDFSKKHHSATLTTAKTTLYTADLDPSDELLLSPVNSPPTMKHRNASQIVLRHRGQHKDNVVDQSVASQHISAHRFRSFSDNSLPESEPRGFSLAERPFTSQSDDARVKTIGAVRVRGRMSPRSSENRLEAVIPAAVIDEQEKWSFSSGSVASQPDTNNNNNNNNKDETVIHQQPKLLGSLSPRVVADDDEFGEYEDPFGDEKPDKESLQGIYQRRSVRQQERYSPVSSVHQQLSSLSELRQMSLPSVKELAAQFSTPRRTQQPRQLPRTPVRSTPTSPFHFRPPEEHDFTLVDQSYTPDSGLSIVRQKRKSSSGESQTSSSTMSSPSPRRSSSSLGFR